MYGNGIAGVENGNLLTGKWKFSEGNGNTAMENGNSAMEMEVMWCVEISDGNWNRLPGLEVQKWKVEIISERMEIPDGKQEVEECTWKTLPDDKK